MNPTIPPRWTEDEFEEHLTVSATAFREERIREPIEQYREVFDGYAARIRALLAGTNHLTNWADALEVILSDDVGLDALRYVAGPPISADDLKTLAHASLAPSRLRDDPKMATRVLQVVLTSLDAKRFPWVADQRRPEQVELRAAELASASLMATQRVQTDRRNLAKLQQENKVADYLVEIGLTEVGPREIRTSDDAPGRGSFCRECMFGDRKADLVVQLHDARLMPIECKVSNSATNSVKRLNNDAAVKAEAWIKQFGTRQTVPTAVLSGVFKRHNLIQAQEAGLTIFWAHDLNPLGEFIGSTAELAQ